MLRHKLVALVLIALYALTPYPLIGMTTDNAPEPNNSLCRCCINHQSCCCLQCKGHQDHTATEGFCSCKDDSDDALSADPAATESFAKVTPVLQPLYDVSPTHYQPFTGFAELSDKPPSV